MLQERFRKSFVPTFYRNVHAVVVVYDVNDARSFDHARDWLREVDLNCYRDDVVCMLVGNKNDDPQAKVVDAAAAREFADLRDMPHYETSAMMDVNVNLVFSKLTELALVAKSKRMGFSTPEPKNAITLTSSSQKKQKKKRKSCCE